MSTARQRHTKGRMNRRRSQIRLLAPQLVVCNHCKAMKISHFVCGRCGYYGTTEVIDTLAKLTKKERKKKEKEQAARAEAESQARQGEEIVPAHKAPQL